MRQLLFTICILFIPCFNILAQCYCDDCPEDIIANTQTFATIDVSGATNNILGQNGQELVNVGLLFTHDAAQELSLRIIAPDGSFVDLTIGEGLDFGENNYFDIDFVQCGSSANPSCGTNPTWNSLDDWNEGPYSGSYYPESGCLEDLTGDINGTWTLQIEDVFFIEDGELFCFDLTFADPSGISCNSSDCGEVFCEAQSGIGMTPVSVTAPQGDPSLIIDFVIEYNSCETPAPSPEYITIFVIHLPFPGPIIDIQTGTVDLTGLPPGTYLVQPFSIVASDLPQVEALDYATTTQADLVIMINNGEICADNSFYSSTINIDNCAIDFTGTLEFDAITADVGDPALDPTWDITWSPAAPDFSIYGLYYVVYDQTTGVIINYILIDDFTWAAAGDYHVAVLVYNLNDENNLPPLGGVSQYIDIVNAIIDEDICAIIFGNNQLFISEECTIDANGVLEQEDITAPQNDPSLDPDWDITFSGTPPDPALYGYYFLVVNLDDDELVAYYTSDNFTLLLEGNYYVVVIYYLLDDLQELLPPNGINTFADLVALINNGDLCAQYFGYNTLTITPQCNADAGTFNPLTIEECVGSNNLINTITPDYSGGFDPGSDYSYSYIISQNGFVIDILPDANFTSLDAGIYEICGFSYLTTDENQIPVPDGSFPVSTIDQLNTDGTICGDITDQCLTLTLNDAPDPMFTGPTTVCAGVLYTYEIENYTGVFSDYLLTINMGGFFQFTWDDITGEVFINWSQGPGNICVTQFDGGCETQVCLTIDVVDDIDITITGDDEICEDEQITYTITPEPLPGESYQITVNGGTIVTQNGGSVTILWDGSGPYNITAELIGGQCAGSETLDISVIPPVDFPVVSIPLTGCTGSGLAIPDISDPLILDWEWTATNADIIISAGFVNFTWLGAGPAQICLEIETACDVDQMCYDVDILQSPEPFIDPVINTCSLTFTLDATPSNGNSWFWSSPGSGATVSYSNQTSFNTDVTVTGPGTYTFILQEFSNSCSGTVETTVTVDQGLLTSDPIFDCLNDGNYLVTFTILDGNPDYSVDGNIITGDTYTSAPILDGNSFSFLVVDQDGCEEVVTGSHVCPCLSDAGTMLQDPIELCITSSDNAFGIHFADAIFDFNDQGIYVLHTSSGNTLGTIIDQNDTGEFSFDPSAMLPGLVYYISYVVGNTLNNTVDFTDPCLSISVGQPVVFYEDPTVFAGNDDVICGDTYLLSQDVFPISGSWQVLSSPVGAIADINSNNGQVILTVDMTGVYNLEYTFTDSNGCTGSDQKEIIFTESPMITNIQLECDNSQYTVSFDITGGVAPYQVNGNLITGNSFVSSSFGSGDIYTFQIVDVDGCMSEVTNGTFLCDCESDAGTMSDDELNICALDGSIITGIFNNDATIASGDLGLFFLHTGSSNVLTTVLAVNNTPDFVYDSSFGENVTLYISYVVGEDIGGSINLTSDCLSVSIGQPVNILPVEKIDIEEYTNSCSFSYDLAFDDLGYDGEWSVISNPASSTVDFSDANISNSTISVDAPGEYLISWMPIGSECTIGDSLTLIFEPLFELESIQEECIDDLSGYIISVTLQGGVAPYFVDGVEVTGGFISDTLLSGSFYNYEATDSRGCIVDISGSFECLCENEAGTMAFDTLIGCREEFLTATYNQDAILGSSDIGQFIIYSGTNAEIDFIIELSENNVISYSDDFAFGDVYYIAYAIGQSDLLGNINLLDPCLQISNGQPFVFSESDSVNAGNDFDVCGFETTLSGNASETQILWRLINQPVGSSVNFDDLDINTDIMVNQVGDYTFELSTGGSICPARDSIVLTFLPELEYQLESTECTAEGYMDVYTLTGGTIPYFINGVEIIGNTYSTPLLPQGEVYSLTLADSGLCSDVVINGESSCNCESEAGTIDISLISVCSSSIIPLEPLSNLDFNLDLDDNISWVIHTSDNNSLGDVIGIIGYNPISFISFDVFDFEYDVIYYVSLVVGNIGAIADPSSDPCLSVSFGAPFIFEKPVELSSGEDQFFCGPITTLIGTSPDTNTIWKINDPNSGVNIDWNPENYQSEINLSSPGLYSFSLIPLDTECYVTDTVFVTSFAEPLSAEIDSTVVTCNNSNFGSFIDLNEQILSGFTDGFWSQDGAEISPIIDFDGEEAREYTVSYVSFSQECGVLMYDVKITVEDCNCPEISYDIIDASCFGFSDGSINLSLSDDEVLEDYSILINDEPYTQLSINDLTAGSYFVDITGTEDCKYEFDIVINEPSPISISLGGDMNVEIDDSVTITAITDLVMSNIESVQWQDLSGMIDEDGLELLTSFSSNDSISIQIEDEAGCIAYDNIKIRVSNSDFILPNVLSPNSQSGNEVFSLKNILGVELIKHFSIYDRWGNIMYNAENVDPNSELATWDGTYNGDQVANGVYVYRIVIIFGAEEISLFGDLTVIR